MRHCVQKVSWKSKKDACNVHLTFDIFLFVYDCMDEKHVVMK